MNILDSDNANPSITVYSPFVSVVVPAYNGARTIRKCLESLLAQDYPRDSYEIIIVDNASTDGTIDLINPGEANVVSETQILNAYGARNQGIRHARGEVIAFTDADCVADPSWLSMIVAPFADRQIGAVSGSVKSCLSPESTEIERFLAKVSQFEITNSKADYPVILTGSAAFRKECLFQVGLFDEYQPSSGDVDLGWRIHQRTNYRVIYAPAALVYHQDHQSARAMFHQFRRHGFGEILLDTMYKNSPGYFRPPKVAIVRVVTQVLACANYMRAFIMRGMKRVFGIANRDDQMEALYWLIAESGNVLGKLEGLWFTAFFQRHRTDLVRSSFRKR